MLGTVFFVDTLFRILVSKLATSFHKRTFFVVIIVVTSSDTCFIMYSHMFIETPLGKKASIAYMTLVRSFISMDCTQMLLKFKSVFEYRFTLIAITSPMIARFTM